MPPTHGVLAGHGRCTGHARSQSHCAIGVLGWTPAAHGISIPWGSAFPGDQPVVPCLDPPCSCLAPSGPQSGAWLIYWFHAGGVWIQSCHLPVPRPHLGTAVIPKSPGWRGRSPGPAGQALPRRGGDTCGHPRAQVTQILHWGAPVSPVAAVSPLLGHPEGCRAAVSSPAREQRGRGSGPQQWCQTPQPGHRAATRHCSAPVTPSTCWAAVPWCPNVRIHPGSEAGTPG